MAVRKRRQVQAKTLGDRLRELREGEGWSLREVGARAGVNHGYLSQVERGDVAQPAPAMLHKLAVGYRESFPTLMRWAGYVEADSGVTTNQSRALSYLGDDVSDEELAAIKAILDVLRTKRATMAWHSESLDGELSLEARNEIRERVLRLLRRSDALGIVPTPLDRVMEVAELVAAGAITLDPGERRRLREIFGDLVDFVWTRLQGVIHFRAREVWINPGLYELRKRFVTAHEIGHEVIPWHRDAIAYLDDKERLRSDVRISFEREANQAAIELLAQGDTLRREADDSRLTVRLLSELGAKYQISMQAIARRIVEESRQDAALAIQFRGESGRLGPYHIYSSESFGQRFGWTNRTGIPVAANQASQEAVAGSDQESFCVLDLSEGLVSMEVEALDTSRAQLFLFKPARRPRILRHLLRTG